MVGEYDRRPSRGQVSKKGPFEAEEFLGPPEPEGYRPLVPEGFKISEETRRWLRRKEERERWKQVTKNYVQKLLPFLRELLGPNFYAFPDEEILRKLHENYEEIKAALKQVGYDGNLFAQMIANVVNHVRKERGRRESTSFPFLARGLDHYYILREKYPNLLPEGIHRQEDREILKHIFDHYEEIREALESIGYEGRVPGETFMGIIRALRTLEGIKHSQELDWAARGLDLYFKLKQKYPRLVPENVHKRAHVEILRHLYRWYDEIKRALRDVGYKGKTPGATFMSIIHALRALEGIQHPLELNWSAYELDLYFQLRKTHPHLVPEDLAERGEEEILKHIFDHYPEIVEALEKHGHKSENTAGAFAYMLHSLQSLRGKVGIDPRKAYYLDVLITRILSRYSTPEDLRRAMEEAKRTASPTTVIEIPLEEIYGEEEGEGEYEVREEEAHPLVALLKGNENRELRKVVRKVFPEKDVDKIVERWRHIYEWWKRRRG